MFGRYCATIAFISWTNIASASDDINFKVACRYPEMPGMVDSFTIEKKLKVRIINTNPTSGSAT